MKRTLLMILAIVLLFSSCKNEEPEYSYNEEYINEILVQMNSNISSLKKIIEIKTDGRKVSGVESIDKGYIVTFDDSSKITLYGKNRLKKTSTPYIGVNNYEGKYLWTVTVNEFTQFVEIDKNKQSVLETIPNLKVDGNGFWIIELGGKSIMINDKDGELVRVTDSEEVFACELKETDQIVSFVFLDGTEVVVPKLVKPEQKPDEDEPIAKVESNGFYVVNEDWFGHDEGSVNYFQKNVTGYIPKYRVFRSANPDYKLGTTTCYGAVWGENIYFVSKQGNRLVVADAATMKLKKVITDLGGDGRSFVGIDDNKGYIGYMGGIKPLNLSDFSLGNAIAGVCGQIGNMCVSGGRMFAVVQKGAPFCTTANTLCINLYFIAFSTTPNSFPCAVFLSK
ncbi:MAG: PL29 family lyase N-terminal domain-containing protein [Phocaeicola sp.]|nr:PL29 family lyase N-terminal domain-containing protein [Phocaeicola sp.]